MTVPAPAQSLDLAVLGNCTIAALVDPLARFVWCCVPRLDGDPVFCNLLRDPISSSDGLWEIELIGLVKATQSYIRNTAILETILTDGDGNEVRIVDFIPRFNRWRRIFRPVSIVRLIEPRAGVPRIRVRLKPRHGYGKHPPTITRGSNHIRYILGDEVLRLTTDSPIGFIQNETPFVCDRPLVMILGADESIETDLKVLGVDLFEQTHDYWTDWTRQLALPFEWQDAVIRAAITLKLCSFEESGAIVAALTTSIPESPSSGRNWDYRFCWLRDAFFVVQTLNRLSVTRTMEGYVSYITNIVAAFPSGPLQPIFGIGCEDQLAERQIPAEDLAGYRGMGPVRVGNAAFTQVQNDGYGSVILAVAQSFFDARVARPGDITLFQKLERLGEEAALRWDQPDAGIWEFRTRAEVHTQSSVMCWAACDRLARIAEKLELSERTLYWRSTADRIHAGIMAHTWNEKLQTFVATFDGCDIDASLLLLHDLGFISARDPKFLTTIEAVQRELNTGDYLLRYKRADDFGVPHTSFTICNFWLIEALAASGRVDEAREKFERLLARRSSLGLLSEGVDVNSGELWGNFPQTYSLVGLIRAAVRLSRPWADAF